MQVKRPMTNKVFAVVPSCLTPARLQAKDPDGSNYGPIAVSDVTHQVSHRVPVLVGVVEPFGSSLVYISRVGIIAETKPHWQKMCAKQGPKPAITMPNLPPDDVPGAYPEQRHETTETPDKME